MAPREGGGVSPPIYPPSDTVPFWWRFGEKILILILKDLKLKN